MPTLCEAREHRAKMGQQGAARTSSQTEAPQTYTLSAQAETRSPRDKKNCPVSRQSPEVCCPEKARETRPELAKGRETCKPTRGPEERGLTWRGHSKKRGYRGDGPPGPLRKDKRAPARQNPSGKNPDFRRVERPNRPTKNVKRGATVRRAVGSPPC